MFVEGNFERCRSNLFVAEVQQINLCKVESPVAGRHHLVGQKFESEWQGKIVRCGLVGKTIYNSAVVIGNNTRQFDVFGHNGFTTIIFGKHIVVMTLEVGACLHFAKGFAPDRCHIVAQHAIVVVGHHIVATARLIADEVVLCQGNRQGVRTGFEHISFDVDAEGAVGGRIGALYPEVDGCGGVYFISCLRHPNATIDNHAHSIIVTIYHTRWEGIGAEIVSNGVTGFRTIIGE